MRLDKVFIATFFASIFLAIPTPTAAHPASGIVVDSTGNIYFSDLETVWKVDSAGKLSVFRTGVRGRHVHELSIDNDDNIYGADVSYISEKWISSVWKMSPAGDLTYLVEPTADPPRALSIWHDSQGNMYWIDQNNHTKTQTLLLRRAADGSVSTLAGGAYGYRDGKGTEAQFSSVGGLIVAPDGNIYLADGDSVRRVTLDGEVSTLASRLTVRTSADTPTLFGGDSGALAGLTVDAKGIVFVADGGNRRVLRVANGKADVVLRSEPPFFPTGAFATTAGDVYVLEVGLTIPNISSGPRVRKLSPDGKVATVAMVGEDRNQRSAPRRALERAGITVESMLQFVWEGRAPKFIVLATALMAIALVVWRRTRRAHRV